jgi:glycerol-3-phosphate acyltransferase PlsY
VRRLSVETGGLAMLRYARRMSDAWLGYGLLLLVAYLIGSIPTGVLVAKLTGGVDPRQVGSGRTGGTNALRAMGWTRGVAVALFDGCKGAVPVLIAMYFQAPDVVLALVGVAAVVGAWRSIFLGFHGGRGVATGIGAMFAIAPLVCILAAPVFLIVIALSRYVSLGSLLGSAAAAVIMFGLVVAGVIPPALLVFGIAGAVIVWLAHADNIDRLIHGQERKLSFDRGQRS